MELEEIMYITMYNVSQLYIYTLSIVRYDPCKFNLRNSSLWNSTVNSKV